MRGPVNRQERILFVPLQMVQKTFIPADMQDIFRIRPVCSGQDGNFAGRDISLIIGRRHGIFIYVVDRKIDPVHAAVADQRLCQRRIVFRNHVQYFFQGCRIFTQKHSQIRLASHFFLHKVKSTGRCEQVIKQFDFFSVSAAQLLRKGNLTGKPGRIPAKRPDIRRFLNRLNRPGHSRIRILEKSVCHDFHKIRMPGFDKVPVPRQILFFQSRIADGIRITLVFQKMEPEAHRHPVNRFIM